MKISSDKIHDNISAVMASLGLVAIHFNKKCLGVEGIDLRAHPHHHDHPHHDRHHLYDHHIRQSKGIRSEATTNRHEAKSTLCNILSHLGVGIHHR